MPEFDFRAALDSFKARVEKVFASTFQSRGGNTLDCWFENYFQQSSTIINYFEEANKIAPPTVACKRGCSYCCQVHVAVTAPEVLTIAEHIKTLPNYPEIREHIRQTAAKIKGKDETQRKNEKIPCALLATDGSCSVYPLRPFVCRGWTSMDVQKCIQGQNPEAEPIQFVVHIYELQQSLVKATRAAVEKLGLDNNLMELTLGLDFALSIPGCMDRWLSGEKVFAPALQTDVPKSRLRVLQ